MGRFIASDIVVTPFPFDDLSASKLRPALILAETWPSRYLVVAITSQEKRVMQGAVEITGADLAEGTLMKTSYIRPDIWFTADESILVRKLARLKPEAHHALIDRVCQTFRDYAPDNT